MNRREFSYRALCSAALALAPGAVRGGEGGKPVSRERLEAAFRTGVERLDGLFWSEVLGNWLDRPGEDLRGHFDGRINPPWWSVANLIETMVDFMNATGGEEYDVRIARVYDANVERGSRLQAVAEELKKRGQWHEEDEEKLQRRMRRMSRRRVHGLHFCNEYLDDTAWWGIAWLKAYERFEDPRYLETVRAAHEHMADNWRPGGGVSWAEDEDKRDPNAITNSLFVVLSARLHRVTGESGFMQWAEKALAWEREAKLYDGIAVVDRPGHRGDYWTYNQGAYVGGLTALFEATGNRAYLNEAAKTVETVIDRSGLVREDGVIFEKLGTNGWDAPLFKGIFTRYLAELGRTLKEHGLHEGTVEKIGRTVRTSAEAILRHGTGKHDLYPSDWHGEEKGREFNFNTQLSALIALAAALG